MRPPERYPALDALRGLTILLMIPVNAALAILAAVAGISIGCPFPQWG